MWPKNYTVEAKGIANGNAVTNENERNSYCIPLARAPNELDLHGIRERK